MTIKIYKWSKALLVASLVLATFSACEKKVDNTVPPEEHTIQKDIKATFDIISAENKEWVWPMTLGSEQFNDESMGFVTKFRKDSTADALAIFKKSTYDQLVAAIATGKLDVDTEDLASQLADIFNGYPDWYLRDLLFNNTANASLVTYTKYVLPNFQYFNPIYIADAEKGFRYNVNGPVQLSLTFTNTELFPLLKQEGVLDFDFRIFSFAPEKIDLNGYYTSNTNKETSLYSAATNSTALFAAGSNLFVPEASLRIGNCSIKANGATVAVPAGYTGLSLFYSFYGQQFIPGAAQFGFSLVSSTANVPAALKASNFYVVKSAYSGDVNTVPVGTVLVSLAGVNSTGELDGKVVEFIKS
ncbi:hypothetical protein SAMN05421788_10510 [Filimonas lacunae]|uniref:Uncharacterized protein n=1 Tax=Filimonas lacunae TaxID=477680 RepID=A0A173MD78_9BACT|nr:hypothetical protein [Filimonas lacunae]BAV05543.1 hypothetical protein FLA_1550 [Filimonas lacunae]SIT20471.1 hypothetical protein SAMN05421788_10510 [Filimonas lacunae]